MNSSTFSDRDSQTPRWHWALLGVVGLLRFANLGFLDLQAWDEALYAVRAQGILLFGQWLDQSAVAIDGLYSSLHPPLHVWLTALTFSVFGENEFTARFVSAVAGALTLPVIAAIGKRLANAETGLIAALLFGLNPFVTFFARQGQFDALLVLFLALSAYCFIRAVDEPSYRLWILSGLGLSAALMTKLFIGLGLAVAVFTFLFLRRSPVEKEALKHLISSIAVALLLALPWHMYMAIQHGGGNPLFFLTQSAMVERALFGVEGNIKPLEVFYYVNQLFVLFPVGIVWFLWELQKNWRSTESSMGILLHWFFVTFIVFSLMRTKLAVYILPMLVPVSLLAAKAIWESIQNEFQKIRWFVMLSGTAIAVIWSASQEWRNAIKSVLLSIVSFEMPEDTALVQSAYLTGLLALSVGLAALLTRSDFFSRYRLHAITVFLFVLAGQTLFEVMIADQTRFRDGGAALGEFVRERNIRRIVVAGYERNPQLTYYLDGADIGWREDLSVRRITPPGDTLIYTAWLTGELSGEPGQALLVLEKDKFIRYKVVDPQRFVPTDFRLVFESRRYSAYLRDPAEFYALGTK